MEENGKKYPSLPSNYVTLAQLQERWLKNQQRKQIEKEEEEKRKQKELKEEEERKLCEREFEERKLCEREFKERKRGERENGKRRNKIREGSKAKNNLYRSWPFEENRPIRTEKSFRAIGVSEQKSKESQIGAIVAGNGERKIDGLNKKKSNGKKKGKPTADDDLTGRTERSLPEYAEVEKKIPVVLTERDGEIEGVTSDFPRNGKNPVVEGMILEKKKFEERKREERENGKRRNKIREGSKAKYNLYRPWPFEKNRPIRTEKSFRAIEVNEQKSKESQIGAIVAGNGERKIDGLKKKKKKRNRKKKGKPTADDDLTGRTERSVPEYAEVGKKIPVVLTERDGEIEGVTSDFPRNGKNSVVEGMIPEKKKVLEDRSTEMGGKFKDLSLSGGKGRNERYARNMRGGQWRNNQSSELFNHRSPWKPRDSNFVWVRKGDTLAVDAAEVCNSGKQCHHFCIQNL